MISKHKTMKQTYCFDLDNTLCVVKDGYRNAKPIPERIKKVNELYDAGNRIIIQTARGSSGGRNMFHFTKQQLNDWGVKYDLLSVGEKINADFYIDDKAIKDTDFFKD